MRKIIIFCKFYKNLSKLFQNHLDLICQIICTFFDIFHISFYSNLALLSATFSNFKADNKFVFKSFFIYFGNFPPYYWEFCRLFGLWFYFYFFLGKRRFVRFLARIGRDNRVLFWLFWHNISMILSIFTLFWHFIDVITIKSRLIVGNRYFRHLLLLVIHWQYSGSNTRRDNI